MPYFQWSLTLNVKVNHVLKTGLYISVFTIFTSFVIQLIINLISSEGQEVYKKAEYNLALFVLISPIIESIISIVILRVCIIFISQNASCIALGVVWAGLHSTMGSSISNSIGLCLVSFLSFSVYGWLYFRYLHANFLVNVIIITFPHTLHNIYVYLFIAYFL